MAASVESKLTLTRRRWRILALTLLFALVPAARAQDADRDPPTRAARVVDVVGDAWLFDNDTREWTRLARNQTVGEGDRVRTDDRGRIQCYIARLLDRAPILLPHEQGLPLRHVYAKDVARLVTTMVGRELPPGRAWNVSWGQSMSLEEFLRLLAGIMGVEAPIRKMPRVQLEADGLLPGCSPFSGRWWSGGRSPKTEVPIDRSLGGERS